MSVIVGRVWSIGGKTGVLVEELVRVKLCPHLSRAGSTGLGLKRIF
jgi:hypothetical protein